MENEPRGLPRRPWGPGSPGGPGGPGGPGRLATGARPVVRGKVSLEVIRKSYTITSLKQEHIFTSQVTSRLEEFIDMSQTYSLSVVSTVCIVIPGFPWSPFSPSSPLSPLGPIETKTMNSQREVRTVCGSWCLIGYLRNRSYQASQEDQQGQQDLTRHNRSTEHKSYCTSMESL